MVRSRSEWLETAYHVQHILGINLVMRLKPNNIASK